MPYTGSPPTFSLGEKTGIAAKLNQLRDAIRGFTDPWTSWTPTLTASTTNPTNWTVTGRYMRVGKLVVAHFTLTAAAGVTAGSDQYRVALPATPSSSGLGVVGPVMLWDVSPGAVSTGVIRLATTTYASLIVAPSGDVNHIYPYTWAAGDFIDGTMIYEAA